MTLKQRHEKAHKELQSVAIPYLASLKIEYHIFRLIARKLKISDRTVKNYVESPGKDGFLTEAICQEFKMLAK